jgi:hypothetical protein
MAKYEFQMVITLCGHAKYTGGTRGYVQMDIVAGKYSLRPRHVHASSGGHADAKLHLHDRFHAEYRG